MVKVDVADYDIDKGRSSLDGCPLALAINRVLKEEYKCAVGANTRIVLNSDIVVFKEHWQFSWVTTKEQFAFITAFDNDHIEPSTNREFEFDIPSDYLKEGL